MPAPVDLERHDGPMQHDHQEDALDRFQPCHPASHGARTNQAPASASIGPGLGKRFLSWVADRLPAIPQREQSRGEEIVNSVSHGIGFLVVLVATPFLLTQIAAHGEPALMVGTYVFVTTMLLLYLASTIYHGLPDGHVKHVFRVVEHSAIYLLIAGTYTPFTLGVLQGLWGWALLGLVWTFALAGIALKTLGRASHPVLSTGLYLVMGWLILLAADPLFARMPVTGLLWLLGGGLAYTIGVFFFATDSLLRYGHFIWHLFVMLGTACHYWAVLWYAA